MLGLHCKRHHLSPPSHSWHSTISKQFHVKKHVSQNLPSKTYNTLEHPYPPKKTWNFINVFMSVCEKLPCSLSWFKAFQKMTSQRQCTFVDSSNSATGATHMIWVKSYEAVYGAATTHKTSEMTHIYNDDHLQRGNKSKVNCVLSKRHT
jgi:hypothetical protein